MKLFVLMLVILNPFSQILYLKELMDELDFKDFLYVHVRATILSFSILVSFVLVGEPILNTVFQIQLGSLQVFGGLVNLMIAYRYITVGPGSNVLFRGKISDLAPNITLPYMVGPGMIWLSILMGRTYHAAIGTAMVAGVLLINMAFVLISKLSFQRLRMQSETMLGKYFAIMMRTMALFLGAIGVQMIIDGMQNAFVGLETGVDTSPMNMD